MICLLMATTLTERFCPARREFVVTLGFIQRPRNNRGGGVCNYSVVISAPVWKLRPCPPLLRPRGHRRRPLRMPPRRHRPTGTALPRSRRRGRGADFEVSSQTKGVRFDVGVHARGVAVWFCQEGGGSDRRVRQRQRRRRRRTQRRRPRGGSAVLGREAWRLGRGNSIAAC